MKSWRLLLILILVAACTRKYVDYDVLHKPTFKRDETVTPKAPPMRKGRADSLGRCFNQWLFFSNAEKEKEAYLPDMVRVLCPKSDWLIDARLESQWWTVLVFSRACVQMHTHCPETR